MLLCLCCYLKIISYYRLFFNCVTNSCSHDFEKVLLFSLSDSVGIRTIQFHAILEYWITDFIFGIYKQYRVISKIENYCMFVT